MIKCLEELEDLKTAFIGHCKELKCEENYIKVCENKFSKIEKVLKALEIIKNKKVNLMSFCEIVEEGWTWGQYMEEEDDVNTSGHQFSKERLTEEEFNLLREALS